MRTIATSFVLSTTSFSMLMRINHRRGSPSCRRTWIKGLYEGTAGSLIFGPKINPIQGHPAGQGGPEGLLGILSGMHLRAVLPVCAA